jgi:hypothetical protein
MKLKYERETEPIKDSMRFSGYGIGTAKATYFTTEEMNRMIRQYVNMAAQLPRPIRYPAPADVWEVNPEPLQGN